jgi:LacI family transcriptional regulator
VERLNAQSLSAELRRCGDQGTRGIAFQALEDPLARETASHLTATGTRLFTVVSDLPGIGQGYIGLDTRAAGRTAGYLMGLLCKGSGTVAVIWGGHLYRAHEERESGARSLLRTNYPNIEILDVNCTRDDAEEADGRLTALLSKERTLTGVYCVGAGIIGAVGALERTSHDVRPVVVGHNLTMNTRDFLLRRQMDVIIHQDMTAIAEKALDYLVTPPEKLSNLTGEVPIQIITRENLSNQLNLEPLREYLKMRDPV